MIYSIPDYYHEFECTADACEDTCCAGWQIVVDDHSLKQYRTVKGDFRKRLIKGIDWKRKTFHQKCEKRCAFLNENNLCDIYEHLGRESLCRTCRRYPRHVEEFEGVREITLSLSCPEVARILMNRTEPVVFHTVEKLGEEEYEDFDPFLYSQLVDAREVMLDILRDREMPAAVRERLVFGIAHDMQSRINRKALFACPQVLEKYQKQAAKEFVEAELERESRDPQKQFEHARTVFRRLFKLELLKQEWDIQLLEAEQYLFLGHTAKEYSDITQEFRAWTEETGFPWEIQKEQLLIYFISTYFCGAVYDGEILAKANLAVFSVHVLEEILKSRWIKNGKMIDSEDVVDIVYRYSRELEHSDENLKRMDKILGRVRW